MTGSTDKTTALRLLRGLENGGINPADAHDVAAGLDPVLVHFIVHFLRQTYPASEPAATAVLDRVLALTASHPAIVAKCKAGEQDSVTAWFGTEYTFGEFRGRGRELIEMIVEKLES